MTSDVYFWKGTRASQEGQIEAKVRELAGKVMVGDNFGGKRVLIKSHLGEEGVTTHIRPAIVKTLVDVIKDKNGKPVLGVTTPIYGFGKRRFPDGHREMAELHRFSEEAIGAPLVILDEFEPSKLVGEAEFGSVYVPKIYNEIAKEGGWLVIAAHETGHPFSGFGVISKQYGMGCVDQSTKKALHKILSAYVDPQKCTGCGTCLDMCKSDGIELRDGNLDKRYEQTAHVTESCFACGGCGETCPSDAITVSDRPTREEFYTALMYAASLAAGVFGDRKRNFIDATEISPHCDCFEIDGPHENLCPDIGIAGSRDNSVALDAFCVDRMIKGAGGEKAFHAKLKAYFPSMYVEIPCGFQLEAAEKFRMGSREYKVINL